MPSCALHPEAIRPYGHCSPYLSSPPQTKISQRKRQSVTKHGAVTEDLNLPAACPPFEAPAQDWTYPAGAAAVQRVVPWLFRFMALSTIGYGTFYIAYWRMSQLYAHTDDVVLPMYNASGALVETTVLFKGQRPGFFHFFLWVLELTILLSTAGLSVGQFWEWQERSSITLPIPLPHYHQWLMTSLFGHSGALFDHSAHRRQRADRRRLPAVLQRAARHRSGAHSRPGARLATHAHSPPHARRFSGHRTRRARDGLSQGEASCSRLRRRR